MPFKNENVAAGIPDKSQFQVGTSNVDPNDIVEDGVLLPWPTEPRASWVYYECTVNVMLDSGIVIHNRLPQVDNTPDTLSICDLDDSRMDSIATGGVNLQSKDQYTDIVQRMGHSRYWFRLWGQALRIGHQIPIPGIKYVGGVPAIPYDKNPQWAFNRILPGGNYGGVILWHAAWSLWYSTATAPRTQEIPVADPMAHISGTVPPPRKGIQVPYSGPDNNAVKAVSSGNVARPVGGNVARPNNPNQ